MPIRKFLALVVMSAVIGVGVSVLALKYVVRSPASEPDPDRSVPDAMLVPDPAPPVPGQKADTVAAPEVQRAPVENPAFPEQGVSLRGVVRLGARFNFVLSDGSVVTEKHPDLERYEPSSYVQIAGRKIPLRGAAAQAKAAAVPPPAVIVSN